jgi:glycosyltransferase involved in cell wall biosynthesis
MLGDVAELHLVSTAPSNLPASVGEAYSVYGEDMPTSWRTSVSVLRIYLSTDNPAVVTQLTRPPLHGTMAGGMATINKTPFVYRYSGDRFYEYRVAQGTTKLTAFALGELLGRVPLYLANRYITLGLNGRDRLIARGVDYDDVTLLPPAVDPDPFEEANPVPLDVPTDREIALFVGRLSHLKGIGTLERTIPRVLEHRDDIQFVFLGDEERRPDVPEHFRDHLTIVGRVPPTDVPGYMKAADILIHPSLTDGIPRVVMESLAAGTPVLARNVGDVASVTENTFETDDEFVERLCSFEDLALDDISPFTVEALTPRYRAFFEQFQ